MARLPGAGSVAGRMNRRTFLAGLVAAPAGAIAAKITATFVPSPSPVSVGVIGDVKFYPRALTEAEVLARYQAAIRGRVLDYDGRVLVNFFDAFGEAPGLIDLKDHAT